MAEQFANERKTLGLNPGKYDLGVLFLLFEGMRPTPAKTAMKAENHSNKGLINTTVGESRLFKYCLLQKIHIFL